jgi:hypothetical protein
LTDAEVTAALDAHDALVKACVEGSLGFDELLMAYGTFPEGIAKEIAGLPRFRQRLAFHSQVAGILAGLDGERADALPLTGRAEVFLEKAVVMRLRQLLARYPDCKAAAGVTGWRNDSRRKR